MKLLLYLCRHLAAISILAAITAVLWTVVFFALLLYALVTSGGIGSPVAYPIVLILLVVGVVSVGLLIFAPACAFGRFAVSITGLPRLAAIPIVFAAGAALSHFAYCLYICALTTHPMPTAATVFLNYLTYLSIPLGAYWWATDGPFALIDALRRRLRRRTILQQTMHTESDS